MEGEENSTKCVFECTNMITKCRISRNASALALMTVGCGTTVHFSFFFYGCRLARSDLYPLQSHSRSLINNKSTRARKSPEWAGRAGTKKSLRTWRCVMSTPWCLQSSLSSNTVNVKDKQWGLSGASSRACVCAPITPCEKKTKQKKNFPSRQKSPEWTFGFLERDLEVASISKTKACSTEPQRQPKRQTMTWLRLRSV